MVLACGTGGKGGNHTTSSKDKRLPAQGLRVSNNWLSDSTAS
jgi:hypothetical protein